MATERIELNVENGIAWVVLNRPDKHNALDLGMFLAIDACIQSLKRRRDLRAVIVSGSGPSFSSGLDIKPILKKPTTALRLLWKWLPGNANLAQRVSVGWRRLKVPVIMVMHGKCWGGGMQIALGGDYRIAATDCSLSVMEAKWGLIPDMGGTLALCECVAIDHAKRLAITAEQLSAEQALAIGLVSQVSDAPLRAAHELALSLAERSPEVNAKIKRMYQQVWGGRERRILAKETLGQLRMLMGNNQRVAVRKATGDVAARYKT
jgi:enoyl-CoA hydratase/carnithine racemase